MSALGEWANVMYDPKSIAHRKLLAQWLINMFADAGFEEAEVSGGELCVDRECSTGRRVFVRVWTSVDKFGEEIRAKDADAIRVTLMYKKLNGDFVPIISKKAQRRVYRVGKFKAIVDRTQQRCRELHAKAKKIKACRCGSPMLKSKNTGNLYCAEKCWLPEAER